MTVTKSATERKLIRCPMSPDGLNRLTAAATEAGMKTSPYCAKLATAALDTEIVIRSLSPYFKHGYIFNDQVFFGSYLGTQKGALDGLMPDDLMTERLPVKLRDNEDEFGRINTLAWALETSWSKALTLLLLEALQQVVHAK